MPSQIEIVFQAPGPHPNGLQATTEGLWILDQETNQVFLVSFNGDLLKTLATASDRGSGITDDGQSLWIASTYSCQILQVDRLTGTTLKAYDAPGPKKPAPMAWSSIIAGSGLRRRRLPRSMKLT